MNKLIKLIIDSTTDGLNVTIDNTLKNNNFIYITWANNITGWIQGN